MGLSKPERFCMSRLNSGTSPGKIWLELQDKFGDKIPHEYEIAFKRMLYCKRERECDVKQEQWKSRHWRDQYLTEKAKRH